MKMEYSKDARQAETMEEYLRCLINERGGNKNVRPRG